MNPLTNKFSKLHQAIQDKSFQVRESEAAWKSAQQTLQNELKDLRALEEEYYQLLGDLKGETTRAVEDAQVGALTPTPVSYPSLEEPMPQLETAPAQPPTAALRMPSPARSKALKALPKKSKKG